MVISRPTEKEAWALADEIVAHADARTPKGFQTFNSDAQAWKGREGRTDPYAKMGGNIYLVGTPEQIVDHFLNLRKAGVDGLQLSFFDFKPDLEFFGENILPLMKQAGLRN